MADLDVQPKKKGMPGLVWLLAVIILLVIILFLMRGCNDNDDMAATTTDSNAVGATVPAGVTNDTSLAWRTPGAGNWDDIDQNAPGASYEEITNKNITVSGNDNYGIYSLGESILFEEGKSTIRKDAEQNLKEIASSINKRFKGGNVRVYGFTDSIGSTGANKELAVQRAAAVRDWLAANGSIDANRISLNPVGEGRPVASNNTEQGRQQNRRVEIIARKP